ncbi:hypothetical protein Tco_1541357 [Tanacetum coccineum]
MAILEFCEKHNMVAYLNKTEGSEDFHEIIDFLSGSHISYALTASPLLYRSLIDQFWQTVVLSTTEEGAQAITAIVDDREIIYHRGILKKTSQTAWEQFSSNIATALICLATNRKYNFSRLIVTNIGVEVELFPSMITIPTPETSPTPLSLPSRITSSLSQTSEPQPSPAAERPVIFTR